MRISAQLPARLALVATLACALSVGAGRHARADTPAFREASALWDKGKTAQAAAKYEAALDGGGLAPAEVVTAYARLGTARAAAGHADAALSAFRLAAALDPDFALPKDAGPKSAALYEKAHKEAERLGGKLEIKAAVPTRTAALRSFDVTCKLAEAIVPLVDHVGIEVSDDQGGSPWRADAPAEATVVFAVPRATVTPGARLAVKVSALDARGNRLATTEGNVSVHGKAAAGDDDAVAAAAGEEHGAGFWSTAWPYVIGGAIVAGSVTAFALTRHSGNVTVGEPAWR